MNNTFQLGDIGATKGKGVAAWLCRKLFIPRTDRYHYFLIGEYLPKDKDYIILESITSKGVTIGRLSWYRPGQYDVYRLGDPASQYLGRRAMIEATKFGRAHYDYFIPIKLLLGVMRLMLSFRFPPWLAQEIPYARDNRLLCTELVNEAYMAVGCPLVPRKVCPLPSAMQEAVGKGKLVKIFPMEVE